MLHAQNRGAPRACGRAARRRNRVSGLRINSMESSSVWKAPFFHVRDKLGLHVELTNPYTTKLIAESKKTDKVDARVLADMGRGGYRWRATCRPGRAWPTGTW